jgi:hypothetical protein
VGFEPTSPLLAGYPLSRRALSTAQTPLRDKRLNFSLAKANEKRQRLYSLQRINEDAAEALTDDRKAADVRISAGW